MNILAIESSCDDTAAAVIENSKVKSNVISSQKFHGEYGGIVPELASRSHTQVIYSIVKKSLEDAKTKINDIDAIAVTSSPGLVGSLMVGSNFAKGLSIKYGLPLIPINHIEGHIFSGNLEDPTLEFPLISLVVSGGHTSIFKVNSFNDYEVLGSTIDDAAGEAFDKIAKMLGMTYPGGPLIDKASKNGDPEFHKFPRPLLDKDNFNFSFSGLKTAVRYFLSNRYPDGDFEKDVDNICASVQRAIVDVLVKKTIKAAQNYKIKNIVIGGGVSANSELRDTMKNEADKIGARLVLPSMDYCIDNAAMIGFLAEEKSKEKDINEFNDLTFVCSPAPIRAKQR